MKRKNTFRGKLAVLLVAIIIVVSFSEGQSKDWWIAGVLGAWVSWVLISVWLIPNLPVIRARINRRKREREIRRIAAEAEMESELYTNGSQTETALLRHVSCRISTSLKAACPEATWEWCTADAVQIATHGGTARIKLHGVAEYTHADVTIDKLGRIECDLLRVVPLSEFGGYTEYTGPNSACDKLRIDPDTWYSVHAKEVLERCIASLNSCGHSSLVIKDSGEICVQQSDKENVYCFIKNVPERSCWETLVKTFERDGLAASIGDSGMRVSW